MNKRILIFLTALMFILACNTFSGSPTAPSGLLATLAASTPLQGDPANPSLTTPTSAFNFATPASTLVVPTSSQTNQPTGKIAFTCQVYKVQASNQICIINADGSGFRRLTTDGTRQHYYPSISPDGQSVVYAAFREANVYEIYEMDIASGEVRQLTNRLGIVNGPEISPDGGSIVFKNTTVNSNRNLIMLMDRNGDNANNIPGITGWDPTWSPDGKYILFASDMDGTVQLYTIRKNGNELRKISSLPAIRGRSDWSIDGQYIVTYSGEPWKREVYIMNADGSNARVLSPVGGNSQGPSISPDGQWVAFTAYFDHYEDDHGCEIYIMRIDATDLRRLTDNDYCDYQPRWGP
jgi:Tol biopolymer transport system component